MSAGGVSSEDFFYGICIAGDCRGVDISGRQAGMS